MKGYIYINKIIVAFFNDDVTSRPGRGRWMERKAFQGLIGNYG